MTPPSAVERLARRLATSLACALVLYAGAVQGLSALLLLAGIGLHAAVLPVGLLVALALLSLVTRHWDDPASARLHTATAALLLLVLTLAGLTASAVHDVSFDGQTYQQEGVLQLAYGWNPVWDAPAAVRQLWPVDHYPKGASLLAASVYLFTGAIESAKAVTLVFMATAWAAALAACLHVRPGRGLTVPVAVASIVALNPVAATQWTGFFVDGQMAGLLGTVLAWMALASVHARRWPLALLGITVALLVTTKFTGLVYAVTLSAGFVAVMTWQRGRTEAWPVARWVGGGLVVGTLVVGANPYLTNTLRHGHPLYPLAGPGAIDVMDAQRPGGFDAAGRLSRLTQSTFARSASVTAPAVPTWKWPVQVAADEFRSFAVADVRAAGFGPLFAAALLLAAAVGMVLIRTDRTTAGWTAMVAGGLLASVLVNPEAWWARLAPQLWLVPTVVAYAGASGRATPARWLSIVLVGLLVVNAAGIAIAHTHAAISRTRVVRSQLIELAARPHPLRVRFGAFYSNRVRLQEHGIPYLDMDQLPCARTESLAYSQTRLCVAP